ncbi:phytanoyl-CoA dioxygenase family protein [Emticicia sp. 17c]|uniref:phytanoyl-CoA dioxygenase family protein n=1 Tax=Emticicia sp. 17c TaxID=3127704 RepID=UPI00301CBA30
MLASEIPKDNLATNGYAIINDFFSNTEINHLLNILSAIDISKPTFRKTNDLFAIRQFLKEVPQAKDIIFNTRFKSLLRTLFGGDFFVIKSIYFDKPEESNWFVAYHQDLTISVDKKIPIAGFGPWTTKHNQFAVQPPLEYLENIFTVRIHLDDTNEGNGALKVIPKSHLKSIYRPENIDWTTETEEICCVNKGGIMFMKPLLLHASSRTTNHQKRRVIHIEFSSKQLPEGLQWSEYLSFMPQSD